jgi:hypothetical protein
MSNYLLVRDGARNRRPGFQRSRLASAGLLTYQRPQVRKLPDSGEPLPRSLDEWLRRPTREIGRTGPDGIWPLR